MPELGLPRTPGVGGSTGNNTLAIYQLWPGEAQPVYGRMMAGIVTMIDRCRTILIRSSLGIRIRTDRPNSANDGQPSQKFARSIMGWCTTFVLVTEDMIPGHADSVDSPQNAYYAGLSKMQVGAGCLFRDAQGRILLVKPTYKDIWELPGGAAEEDESPLVTCQREIREELGFDVAPRCLLAIDYREPATDLRGSALRFVFSGGVLDDSAVEAIQLDQTELSSFRFVGADELDSYVTPVMARRLRSIIDMQGQGFLYLEEGRDVLG